MSLQQFLVPQFIDAETKIFGPITTRQFIIMMIAGMFDFIFYKIFYFTTFVIVALIVTAICGGIAFIRINGMPFHYFFLNLVQSFSRPRLRLWCKEIINALPPEVKEEVKKEFIPKKPIETAKLSSLSLIVNTGGAYKEEE